MFGPRKRRLHVANALALACVTATCFLAACSDDGDGSGGTAGADAGGSSGKASAGGGGKAGASTANGGASASSGQAGEENVAGDSGAGGEAGAEAGGSAGTSGSTAGTGGSAGGATSGSAGSAGAPPVLVPNCVRDTTSGKTIAISADGNDALFGLTHAADGSLYAAGYVQTGVVATEDRSTVVVKIKADGTLDTTWAAQGIAKVNVRATAAGLGGGEMPRGIAFQGTKIIVAGTVETYTTAQTETVLNNDRDVY